MTAHGSQPPLSRRQVLMGGLGGALTAQDALSARPVRKASSVVLTDAEQLQRRLDRTGEIVMSRAYELDRPLIVSGGQRITGNGEAKLIWKGAPDQPVLCDGSVVDPRQSHHQMLLQGFQIIGSSGGIARMPRSGIEFYRTGGVTIRQVSVNGVTGSGIRWGASMADTRGILVELCVINDCQAGDAIQGVGREVVVRDNRIGSTNSDRRAFGDTGIALLADFNPMTNPDGDYSRDIRIERNRIYGHGRHSPDAKPSTAIALGPFAPGHNASTVIANNLVSGCYVNIWIVAMRGVRIERNVFRPHSSLLTGNLRFDGVSDLAVSGNMIQLSGDGQGPDYSALLLNAGRFVYGASTFDCDVTGFLIDGNDIVSQTAANGIRLRFAEAKKNPDFVSRLLDGRIERNRFQGLRRPIVFAPESGEPTDTCRSITLAGNQFDQSAQAMAVLMGNTHQYKNVYLQKANTNQRLPIAIGTGFRDIN